MKINNIYIKSYKGLEEVEIKLIEPPLNYFRKLKMTIVVGENGTGKTSILKFLTEVFCPIQTKRNLESEEYNVSEFEVKLNMDGEKIEYSHNKNPSLFPNKVIVSSFSAFDPYTLIPRREKLEEEINEAEYVYAGPIDYHTPTFNLVLNLITEILYSKELEEDKFYTFLGLLNNIGYDYPSFVLVDRSRLSARSEIKKVDSNYDLMVETLEDYRNDLRELFTKKISKTLKKNKRYYCIPLEEYKILYNKYSNILDYNLLKIKDFIFVKGGNEVQLSEMSSGEITMLYRFLPLIIEIEDNSILLIDEPETHLHPTWCQQYVHYLVSLLGGYKAHIIIASHSPMIASEVPLECIVGLQQKDNRITQYFAKDRTFGSSPDTILRDVFNLESLNGVFYKRILENLHSYLKSNDAKNINLAREIYKSLSTSPEKYRIYEKYKDILED